MTSHSTFSLRIFSQSFCQSFCKIVKPSTSFHPILCLLLLSVSSIFSAHAHENAHAKASAHGHEKTAQIKTAQMASSVSVNEPWARSTFALAKTGAAYFTITNTARQTIVLERVSVDQSIAMMAELHHTIMQDDMMRMQELDEGITIKAGETVELSPGGMHVMVMGLQGPLNSGESLAVTLHFEDGSQLAQNFPILDKRK